MLNPHFGEFLLESLGSYFELLREDLIINVMIM
jgi:hypothetical protein